MSQYSATVRVFQPIHVPLLPHKQPPLLKYIMLIAVTFCDFLQLALVLIYNIYTIICLLIIFIRSYLIFCCFFRIMPTAQYTSKWDFGLLYCLYKRFTSTHDHCQSTLRTHPVVPNVCAAMWRMNPPAM